MSHQSRYKEVEVKARVTKKMRQELEDIAQKKGEALSLVVREALAEYLTKAEKPAPNKLGFAR